MSLITIEYKHSLWALKSAILIHDTVTKLLIKQSRCSIMLAGGAGAKEVYSCWQSLSGFSDLIKITFYQADERCVEPSSIHSNFRLLKESLFLNTFPRNCSMLRMLGESSNLSKEIIRYESFIPDQVDIIILGVGDDGHIASIFSSDDIYIRKKIFLSQSKSHAFKRITIGAPIIQRAKNVFVLAKGEKKRAVFAKSFNEFESILSTPLQITFAHSTWLFSKE
jgi:6-phosphogluconolactonase